MELKKGAICAKIAQMYNEGLENKYPSAKIYFANIFKCEHNPTS